MQGNYLLKYKLGRIDMSQGKDEPIFHGDFGMLHDYVEATDDGQPIDMDDDEGARDWLNGLFAAMGSDVKLE